MYCIIMTYSTSYCHPTNLWDGMGWEWMEYICMCMCDMNLALTGSSELVVLVLYNRGLYIMVL
jgi:hypothetical protein